MDLFGFYVTCGLIVVIVLLYWVYIFVEVLVDEGTWAPTYKRSTNEESKDVKKSWRPWEVIYPIFRWLFPFRSLPSEKKNKGSQEEWGDGLLVRQNSLTHKDIEAFFSRKYIASQEALPPEKRYLEPRCTGPNCRNCRNVAGATPMQLLELYRALK